ncbi:hypothetical protein Vsou_15770 [Vulcanisaeta souniana JCM 11219]|nr:hypothetical protein Vsou_15770 [Vulcanisaeta souniana JCM 11219]
MMKEYKTLYLRIPCLYLCDKNEYCHFKRILNNILKTLNDNKYFFYDISIASELLNGKLCESEHDQAVDCFMKYNNDVIAFEFTNGLNIQCDELRNKYCTKDDKAKVFVIIEVSAIRTIIGCLKSDNVKCEFLPGINLMDLCNDNIINSIIDLISKGNKCIIITIKL